MKAIETRIYGCRFRSRLEARWAVFFTSLDLRWEYEPEGFEIDGEPYLPDFRVWTPQRKPMWFEIKPEHIQSDGKFEKFKAALEAEIDPYSCATPRAMLLNGDPHQFLQKNTICPRCGFVLEKRWQQIEPGHYSFFYCWHCDAETPSGGGNPEEADGVKCAKYAPHKGDLEVSAPELRQFLGLVDGAITSAMSARFEHGEAKRYRR